MSEQIEILGVKYVDGYKLALTFDDGKEVTADFKLFLEASSHPEIKKYLDLKLFKSFKVIDGDLDWNDFDLVFPIYDLYTNSI